MTAPIGIILGVVIVLVLVPVAAAVVYRLVFVRRNSTSVLLRRGGESTWDYGAVRYSETEVAFYRLLSVKFGADLRLDRRGLILGPRRQPTGAELDVAEEGEVIVTFRGHDRRNRPVEGELCVAPAKLTGMLAWVEACSTEQIRPRRPHR
ncbi:DUF2550 family protein [Dietzia sp. ANT_WB102]|uniref:DUF2550 family protein n=1 Tax=Dietzia sp. ANT_WB102 TaxID=2597345 RepID=UPI0011ED1F95|nr:DUF2550 family protein [Dietzia sp. ANT_WB102]KAA0919455.1 DUF2550 family protein [Dietzia sp. ANT_WB102]